MNSSKSRTFCTDLGEFILSGRRKRLYTRGQGIKIICGFNGAELAGEAVTGKLFLYLACQLIINRAEKYDQAFKRQQNPGRSRDYGRAPQPSLFRDNDGIKPFSACRAFDLLKHRSIKNSEANKDS